MTNQLITPPRALDRNGEPQAGALCYVYQSGTLTAVTVTDSAGTALTWPVSADIDGAFPQMFYAGAYALKAIITDAAGVVLPAGTIDPVAVVTNVSTAAAIAFAPTAEVPQTNVQAAVQAIGVGAVANTAAIALLDAAVIAGAGLATGSGTLPASVTLTVTAASDAEGITGTLITKAMTPKATKAAMDASKVTMTTTTAAGTAVNFTGIPAWARKITVLMKGISTSGTSNITVQVGVAAGIVAAGYISAYQRGTTNASQSVGFAAAPFVLAADTTYAVLQLFHMGGNVWMASGQSADIDVAAVAINAGSITLADVLDRVRVTMANGTDTFDAGTINVMYE